MNLKSLAPNQTQITFPDGTVVFFSYSTPVAAFVPGRGYLKSATKHSVTTSKHVNKWTEGRATVVPQCEIDSIANR